MSQGKSKTKKLKCSICGDYFEALKRSAKHCAACRAEMDREEGEDGESQ